MKKIYLIILLLSALPCFCQEVCDNGIDDDGDGLVDLNDDECICSDVQSIIPNPSFEEFDMCPNWYSQMNYCADWMQATSTTTDFMHTCNYVLQTVINVGLDDFPDGNGIAGEIFSPGKSEYLGSCLTAPMEAGTEYQMTFHIASLPVYGANLGDCNNGTIYYEPVDITLYGSTNCNTMPVTAYDAPTSTSANWFILGSVNYIPVTNWGQITITFTPQTDIDAIMLGAPEVLPASYSNSNCVPYFVFDNILLNQSSLFGANITESGSYCNNNLILTAVTTIPVSDSVTYQWYIDGVAITGANGSTYAVTQAEGNTGNYCVKIIDEGNCIISPSLSVDIMLPPPDTTQTEPTCYENGTITIITTADLYSFDNGVTWTSENVMDNLLPGTYFVRVKTNSGCISAITGVTLTTPNYNNAPNVTTINATCGPTGSIIVTTNASQYSFDNGATWTVNPVLENVYGGQYLVRIKDASGCMSDPIVTYVDQDLLEAPSFTFILPDCFDEGGSLTITTPAAEYSFDEGLTWVTNPTLSNISSGNYWMMIKDSEGCISEANATTLYAQMLDWPDYEISQGCTDQNAILITTPAYEYSMNNGQTWVSTPNFTNLSPGIYQIAIRDENGCQSYPYPILLDGITLNIIPEYELIPPGCNQAGSITILTEAYEYSFNNGDTWTTDNVIENLVTDHYYSLVVRDDFGCMSYGASVYSPPLAFPEAPDVNDIQPDCSNPEGSILVNEPGFQYSFDNGITWGSSNNSGPLEGGTYLVKIKNSQGCESHATEVVIGEALEVPDAPGITVTDPTCTVATGSITINTVASYYSFDNGNTWGTANTLDNASPGTYYIQIKNETDGCASPATEVVIAGTEIDAPLVTVTQPDYFVATGSITITTVADLYSFDNGASWVSTNIQTGLPPGTYYVMVKNEEGCISFATEVAIVPNADASPLPDVTDAAYCQGDTPTPLTATGTNLLWYEGPNGGIGSSEAPVPSTAEGGITTYYVSQTLNGCESARAVITVTVWPTPQPPAGDDLAYCQGDATTALTATGTNLLWYDAPAGGTGTATPPLPSSQVTGIFVYYVSQTVNGCESDRTAITVLINPVSDAPQTEAVITYEHMDITVALNAVGTNLKWYDSDMNMLNSVPIPSSASIGSTTYYVTQAVNGCEGPPAEITVVITPDYVEIDYPKFFSPNGDTMRDTWNIFTPEHGVKAIVEIYDRYGKIITVLKAPGAGWDGTYNGRNLPATDYWFKVVYKEYGIEKEFKAHFSLLR